MATVTQIGPRLGIAPTCAALGLPRATYYRRRRPQNAPPRRRASPRGLSEVERTAVLAVLHEPQFVDLAPAEVYATLLDEGRYFCSERTMYRLLAALGITKTHSRPHVSNDNPFSEAQFKTLKYRPDFPARFGSIQDARAHCHGFFPWYNTEHHHSGLGRLTPYDVHYGLAEQRVAARATVLATAYTTHPERFPAGLPPSASAPRGSVDQLTQARDGGDSRTRGNSR